MPEAWKKTDAVAYYLPISILTIIWNTVNFIWLGKKRRPLPTKPNAGVHTVLSLAFLLLGVICTIIVAGARGKLFNDLYDLQTDGSHDVAAANGTIVQVSSQNVASCPAFSDCVEQQHWLDRAYLRNGIAIGGCVLVDIAFLIHCGLSIWFLLIAIHGVDRRPAVPPKDEMEKREEAKSPWAQNGNAVIQTECSFGNHSWNQSEAALLSANPPFGIHDAASCSSISVSGMSTMESPRFLEAPRPAPTPVPSSTSHFGPPKGSPGRESLFSPSASQFQRMDLPDPFKTDSPSCAGEHDDSIPPMLFPQRPYWGISTQNFSRPSSSRGDPSIPMPERYNFYPRVGRSNSQVSPPRSPGLSPRSRSGQLSNGRPKTADFGRSEFKITALPPVPHFKDSRRVQSGWI
ncbi:hypothetical protein Vi05172_g6135 [Venturia inaequalis]|nr:hypothetical protein Vi05172_g6135 [Venturia inaequalis]